jgi:hypothetical protein
MVQLHQPFNGYSETGGLRDGTGVQVFRPLKRPALKVLADVRATHALLLEIFRPPSIVAHFGQKLVITLELSTQACGLAA